ncbi:hypothetical protein, partial [Bacteroides acidifaciens]|uniref:hypothetical protein n=1 Tax=Bacteroides acidifaciens TaxID=85831 RepID=UPI0025ADA95D
KLNALILIYTYSCLSLTAGHLPMQCVEHLVAQRIANLRVQSPEIASSYLLKLANSDLLRPAFLHPQS